MIEQLALAAERAGSQIEVLVEIDVGARRCGVRPGPAATGLARQITGSRFLAFGGLQAYHGSAQHLRTPEERRAAIANAANATTETMRFLNEAGFTCRTIGGAGTGTFELEGASGIWNELQAGLLHLHGRRLRQKCRRRGAQCQPVRACALCSRDRDEHRLRRTRRGRCGPQGAVERQRISVCPRPARPALPSALRRTRRTRIRQRSLKARRSATG